VATSTQSRFAGCLTASWLAVRLGVEPAKIEGLRRAGELIAVREAGSTVWLYPPWQFDGLEPLSSIPRVTRAAREAHVDEERLYTILSARRGLTGDERVYELLREGRVDEVVALVRAG
jgi:hypothetical protein